MSQFSEIMTNKSEIKISEDVSANGVWANVSQEIRISELEKALSDTVTYLKRLPINHETLKAAKAAQAVLDKPYEPATRYFSAIHSEMGIVRLKVEVSAAGVNVRTDVPDEDPAKAGQRGHQLISQLAVGCKLPPLREERFAAFGAGQMRFRPQTLPFDDRLTRVARAMCLSRFDDPDSPGRGSGNEFRWQDYAAMAKVAIDSY